MKSKKIFLISARCKKYLEVFFSCAFLLILTSCKDKYEYMKGHYTYRTTSSAPSTWNPTDWKMNNEGGILDYITSSLYQFVLNDSRDGYKIICELAEEFPEDVSRSYAGNSKYKVPSNALSGWAWKVKLRKDAVWDDGTPINAHSFEYSMKQFLNPLMKNYRASSFFQDSLALANAESYYNGKGKWEDVGFILNDDYTFTLVLTKSISDFMCIYSMGSLTLVKEDIYEANKKDTGGLLKSSYGTSLETSASYGPYKIKSYQAEKEISFEKNPSWYGWNDGEHEGLYQTTDISILFIDKHSTILSLFLQGNLDDVGLSVDDLARYGNSEFRVVTPQTYTYKLSFNIDRAALVSEENDGNNHSIIANKNFRHAFSLALDRRTFVQTLAPSSDPGFGLINRMYIADPESGQSYRDCEDAKRIMCEFYNTKSEEHITGFDRDLSRKLFQLSYDEEIKNGSLKKGQTVQIDFHTYNADDIMIKNIAFIQDSVNKATEGTDLEGKIYIKQITDEDYYNNMKAGKVDLAYTAWGGGAMDPYGIMWCYCTNDASNEYGFNPETEKLSIELNGKVLNKTYNEWYTALCEKEYSSAPSNIRNKILAEMEKGLLSYYNMIPLRYLNSIGLNSQRLVEGSEEYINALVGRGSIRELSYTLDDYDWNRYCLQERKQLRY